MGIPTSAFLLAAVPPGHMRGMGLAHLSWEEGQGKGLQVTDMMNRRLWPTFGLNINPPAAHQHLAGVSLHYSWRPGSISPSPDTHPTS